jgi:hypothetical protein
MIEPSLVERIDDWRFANRVSSRSRAMRRLMELSLRDHEKAISTRLAASEVQIDD